MRAVTFTDTKMKFPFFYFFLLLKFCQGVEGTMLYVNENCNDSETYDGNDESTTLYLMPPSDEIHRERNERFIKSATHLGFTVSDIEVNPECSYEYFTTFEITYGLIKKYVTSTIINLKANVPINYLYNYYESDEDRIKNIVSIGYTNITQLINTEVLNCTKNNETCSISKVNSSECYITLTSPLKYKALHEIIEHIDDEHYINNYVTQLQSKQMGMPIQKHSVIICSKNFDSNHKTQSIKYHIIKECKNVNDFAVHDVLAVIAPKPFGSEDLIYLPVIFYDTPYLMPKDEAVYPYSTTLYDYNFDKVTKLVVNILKKNGFTRVAMVSDDWLNSDKFEERMIGHFNKHEMVYSVQQCSGVDCNFTKALKWLKEVDATVIVANVDERHVVQLAHSAADAGFTASDNVLWILRDCPLSVKSECINLGHTFQKRKALKKYKALQVFSQLLCVSTLPTAGLNNREQSQISKALDYITRSFSKMSPKMQEDILQYSQRKRSKIIINYIEKIKEYAPAYDRNLTIKGTECESFILNKIGPLQLDSFHATCFWRSKKFHAPCEDYYILAILLTILGVLVIILIILICGKKCNPRLRKYRTFN